MAEAMPASVAESVASSSAADLAWGLTTQDGDVDMSSGVRRAGWNLKTLRERLGSAFAEAAKTHGGAMQFLEQRYKNIDEKQSYANRLWREFPPLDHRPPVLSWPIPTIKEQDRNDDSIIFLHLAQLDFSRRATLKGPPALRTCLLLADDILTSGFITLGDALLVTPLEGLGPILEGPWADGMGNQSPAFCIGYVKGMARICTLHMLVTLCLDDDPPPREAQPAKRIVALDMWSNGKHKLGQRVVCK